MLLGRSGYFSGTPEELLLSHTPITATRCDVSLTEEAAAALGSCALDVVSGQLAAVLHAGGVLQDAVLLKQSTASVRSVAAPKLRFMAHTEHAAGLQAVQALNLFSSVSSFLGSPGQANYAAANSALNAWAQLLQRRGLAGSSVQWGAWAGVGMAHGNAMVLARVERSGLGVVQPARGLAALQAVLGGSASAQLVQVRPLIRAALLALVQYGIP